MHKANESDYMNHDYIFIIIYGSWYTEFIIK